MAAIKIGQAYKPIEVDLWGAPYETRDVTRSGAKQAAELSEKVDGLEEGRDDEAIGFLAELLDLRLTNANGSKKKASTHIKEKWEADELSLGQLFAFIRAINEVEQEQRPT